MAAVLLLQCREGAEAQRLLRGGASCDEFAATGQLLRRCIERTDLPVELAVQIAFRMLDWQTWVRCYVVLLMLLLCVLWRCSLIAA